MPSGGAGSVSGSSGSAGRSSTRRKLPGDAAAEVMYLQPDAPERKEKSDVAERFDQIDGIFGDDLADEPARPRRSKRRSRSEQAAAPSSDRRPTRFPGVTFVEVFNRCRRANCRVCQGANGSSHGPVAVAHPIDQVGQGGPRGPLSDARPSKRLPGSPAGPRPGAVGAREEEPPAPPERAEVADAPEAPPVAAEVADAPEAPPVAAEVADEPQAPPAASPPSPTSFWTPVSEKTKPTPLRSGRPVGDTAVATKASPTRAVQRKSDSVEEDAPVAKKASPTRPVEGKAKPAEEDAPVAKKASPTRPVQAKPVAAQGDAPADDLEWRGRVALEERGFEFRVETGARQLARHGSPRPLKGSSGSAKTGDDAKTGDRADDLQSRLDQILERAKRVGFTPTSHDNARSYAPATRSVDRQPPGGGPQ